MRSLFTVDAKYTVDTCSFNEIFDEKRHFNKQNFPGIWDGILELILKGEIISHREAYEEIMKGPYEELKIWARRNSAIFMAHDYAREGEFIAEIGENGFEEFVHQDKDSFNADPWLVAQAKTNGLTIITQETKRGLRDILRVCEDFKIPCIDIFGLIRSKGWILHRK